MKKFDMYKELEKLCEVRTEFNKAISEILGKSSDGSYAYDSGVVSVRYGEHKYKGEYSKCVKISFTIYEYYADMLDDMTYQDLNTIAKRTGADDVVVSIESNEDNFYIEITLIYFGKDNNRNKSVKNKSRRR